MQIVQMRQIKHEGKRAGGWEKWENCQDVFGTLFSSEKNGKKITGMGWENFSGGFLKREMFLSLGMLFPMDLGILGIAGFWD